MEQLSPGPNLNDCNKIPPEKQLSDRGRTELHCHGQSQTARDSKHETETLKGRPENVFDIEMLGSRQTAICKQRDRPKQKQTAVHPVTGTSTGYHFPA